MAGLKKRISTLPTGIGYPGTSRLVLVLIFAGIGGWLLGSAASTVLGALFTGMTRLVSRLTDPTSRVEFPSNFLNVAPFALLGAILGGFIGNRFGGYLDRLAQRWDKMEPGEKVNVFLGIVIGLVASIPFILMFQALALPSVYFALLIVGAIVLFASLTIYALDSMADMLPWSKQRGKARRSGIRVMDTNVIIDGRIYDVAKTGFIDGQLYVPGFVLEELQYIADSHDSQRRQRGRRGLEVLKHMQAEFSLEVRIHDRLAPEMNDEVDSRLVRLAKALGADIITNDFNLKRVAELQDVKVLSLNDLALALRPNVLPGEPLLSLKILKEGNQYGQGIGYLEDGTMVVVENGMGHIGEISDVTVTQVIQTERGKMIFAEIEGDDSGFTSRPPRKPTSPRRSPTNP